MSSTGDKLVTTRRAVLGALTAGALGAALWPRAPRSRADIPAGRTVLTYWEKWTGAEGEAIQRVVDRFNTSQDAIWVRRVPVADIVPKAMVAIAGGDPPDLVGLYSFNIPAFAESQAALALDDLAPFGDRIDPAIYAPAVDRLLHYQGRQWAAVTSCYALGLYCNLAHFRAAGLDPTALPRTISELDHAAERLTRKAPTGQIEQTGFQQNLPQWWPYFWPVLFGSELYDPGLDRPTIADPPGVAAFSWISDTARRLGIAESRSLARTYDRSFHTAADPFFSGRASMIVQGPWLASFARSAAPSLDFACVPVPMADAVFDPSAPLGMVEADVVVIPRGCPHPQESMTFIRFLQRQDVLEELAQAHGKSSPLAAVSPSFLPTHPNPQVRAFDAVIRSRRAVILPQTRVWQQYADMTSGAFDRAWSGEPAQAVLNEVQARAQELMSTATARRRAREAAAQ